MIRRLQVNVVEFAFDLYDTNKTTPAKAGQGPARSCNNPVAMCNTTGQSNTQNRLKDGGNALRASLLLLMDAHTRSRTTLTTSPVSCMSVSYSGVRGKAMFQFSSLQKTENLYGSASKSKQFAGAVPVWCDCARNRVRQQGADDQNMQATLE